MRLVGPLLLVVGMLGGCAHADGGRAVTVLDGDAHLVQTTQPGRATISLERQSRKSGPKIDAVLTMNFEVGARPWYDGREWHEAGVPECLSGTAHHVEVGVVEARPYKSAPGGATLVWLSCVEI